MSKQERHANFSFFEIIILKKKLERNISSIFYCLNEEYSDKVKVHCSLH